MQTNVSNITNNVNNNTVAVNNLQDQVDNLVANPAVSEPYILGRSNQSSNGRFNFGGKKGAQAANAMCQATFSNVPTAHVCQPEEISSALAAESWDANNQNNIHGVATWTLSTQQFSRNNNFLNSTSASSCQGLNYNSGDIARGTNLTIFINSLVGGNGGQAGATYFNVTRDVGCGTNRPVMCCR